MKPKISLGVTTLLAFVGSISMWGYAENAIIEEVYKEGNRSASITLSAEDSTSRIINYKEAGLSAVISDKDIKINCDRNDPCTVGIPAVPFRSNEGLQLIRAVALTKAGKPAGVIPSMGKASKERLANLSGKLEPPAFSFNPDGLGSSLASPQDAPPPSAPAPVPAPRHYHSSRIGVSLNIGAGFGSPKPTFAAAQDPENPIAQDYTTLPGAWVQKTPRAFESFLRFSVPFRRDHPNGWNFGISAGYGTVRAGHRNESANFPTQDAQGNPLMIDVTEKRDGLALHEFVKAGIETGKIGHRLSFYGDVGAFAGHNNPQLTRLDTYTTATCTAVDANNQCTAYSNNAITYQTTFGDNNGWSGVGVAFHAGAKFAFSRVVSAYWDWAKYKADQAYKVNKFGVSFRFH